MKKIAVFMMLLGSVVSYAQGPAAHGKNHSEMMEALLAEKVGFITEYVGLTAEEAQAFWPVYNKIEKEQMALAKEERKAAAALKAALAKGGSDIKALTAAYVAAAKANVNMQAAGADAYYSILSAEKVAKVLLSDEAFRRRQLGKLRQSHGPQQGPQGKASQGRYDGRPCPDASNCPSHGGKPARGDAK